MIVFIFIRCSNLSVVNSRFETEPHSQSTTNYSIWGNDWKNVFTSVYLQLNSCNSNSCNSKDHLNRTNSLVPTEFTSKHLQETSFNSNSHNSKNHLNRTSFGFPGRIFHHVIRILVLETSSFILRYATVVSSNVSIRMS